jgi:hypothetical protein
VRLEGSCHCQAVRFSVEAASPAPYMRCYCSICRKLAGGGGYAINLGADHRTLKIEGVEAIRVYETSPDASTPDAVCGRRFCGQCGTALWHYDPRWPDFVHPFASAIDTDLPEPPSSVHILQNSKANWVKVEAGPEDSVHDAYPPESLTAWHERNGFGAAEE